MPTKTQLGWFLFFNLFVAAHAQISLHQLSPDSGLPGSTASILGSGFQGSVQVQVSGVNATVTLNTATQVNFTVPAAPSGFVTLQVDGVWYTNVVPFTIQRPIQGTFNPPAGISRSGYQVTVGGEIVAVDAGTGQFSGGVDQDGVAVLWAFRDATSPSFMAMVHPLTNQPVVDVSSTAETLVLLNPAINARSASRYTNYVSTLRGLSQFSAFASAINSASVSGLDYLDNAAVENSWINAIQSLLAAAPPPGPAGFRKLGFEPGTPNGTKLRYLNPPDTSQGYGGLRRLQTTLSEPNSSHPDEFLAEFASADRFPPFSNMTDWFVKVYELNPLQFSNSFASVSALMPTENLEKTSLGVLDTATVQAELYSKNLDLLEVASGFLMNLLSSSTVDPHIRTPSQAAIPARRPGVYVSEAYSGNIYHGWGLPGFQNSGGQSQLITDLDGRLTWAVSLGGNVMVAAVDMIGAMGGFTDVYKKTRSRSSGNSTTNETRALVKILDGVAQDVIKGLAVHGNEIASLDVFYDLVKTAVGSVVKNLTAAGLEAAQNASLKDCAARVVKTLGKTVDVAGKVSAFAQGVERSAGLLGSSTLAVERSVIVVGNPFAPRISSFYPTSGRGGELITIQGANFGDSTNGLSVSFRQFAGTDDPTSYTSRIELEVVTNSPTSIAVRLPWTDYGAQFPNGRAYVVVERGNTNFVGSSAALNPPFREFRLLVPPTLTSVHPNPAPAGALLELRGFGFDNETAREYQISIDGMVQGLGFTADSQGTRLLFRPQNISTGLHQVAVVVRDRSSGSLPFTIEHPAYVTPEGVASGYGIDVTQPDFSNTANGKISVQEAFLIIAGQLGRGIEQHLPCELLLPSDPGYCTPQERETDHVYGDEPQTILGPVHTISFAGNMTISGALPQLQSGVRYVFGSVSQPVILDGAGAPAGAAGLVFDGINGAQVSGHLIIRNFTGPGVHIRNGAQNNHLSGIAVVNCGSGFLVEGASTGNELRDCSVTNATGNGIHFTGVGTERNVMSQSGGGGFPPFPYGVITGCGGNGIRVDNGANFNSIVPGTIRNCQSAGIYVGGASNNFFGWATEELLRRYDLFNNQVAGAHLGPGAVGNVMRYLNPLGNQGDGVLLQGPGCSNNVVDRTFAGVNLYEGGTSQTIPNEGSGIRLTAGAQYNLIGSRWVTLGQHGSISGNRDDGVLLEGEDTAFNTVNAQIIGVLDPYVGAQGLRFSANGRSGIALRDGAHDNIIGDHNADLGNAIFGAPEAGIELAGTGTDNNLVFGNQVGAFNSLWVLGSGNRARNGLWIHDGPRNNTIGLPGARVFVPRFAGDTVGVAHQGWNAFNSCTNAGVLIQNAGGQVGTDGTLSGANIIQANHIGELDNGNLAPSGEGAGIKLEAGAEGNVIGGRTPELGNRIRGWFRAGIWIDQNNLSSPSQRNRIENNQIEGPGVGITFRYTDYLTATPSGGVGLLLTSSSGHVIGESQLTRNKFYVNRLGIYLADSSSNVVRGCYITNCHNSGLVVRGGAGNVIGGDDPNSGNLIHAFGLQNEPGWAGVALSHTAGNRLRNNEIGLIAPGRGAMGMLLTNAADNEVGGPARLNGNIFISNFTNALVISGDESAGNKFFNNRIGIDRNGVLKTNRGDGVRLEAGAHDNFIGGLADVTRTVNGLLYSAAIPAGNIITAHEQAGVRIVGPTTTGNRILYNQISGNLAKGIQHENGGNTLQPPPQLVAFDGTSFLGNVVSLANTPAGSTVQLFTDADPTDPEGDAFVGEGTVEANGTWRVTPVGALRHSVLTMTATDGADGSTSEFGVDAPNVIGFVVARTDANPTGLISAGANNEVVFRLSLSAINTDVRVRTLALNATGNLVETAAISEARLYCDNDGDGLPSSADNLLAGPKVFAADNGRLDFTDLNAVISGNSTQNWIVTYSLLANTPVASTFQLSLTNADSVDAEYINPPLAKATPEGNFAIESAVYTVQAATGNPDDTDNDGLSDSWEQTHFKTLDRDGTDDLDEDGFSDFAEFLLGTDPDDEESRLEMIPRPLVGPAGATVAWKSVAGKIYRLQFKNDLEDALWQNLFGDVVGESEVTSKTDSSGAGENQRYYRVILLP